MNWKLTLDDIKDILFLDRDKDVVNASVIWRKNIPRPDFMKSEVPVQLEYYFW
jgi:hypothetical protein